MPSLSWVKTMGVASNEKGKSITKDPFNGDLYVTSSFLNC